MRNLKKLLALIVAVTTILTFTVPAFAADATTAAKTDAQVVTDLGVVLGSGSGVTADYLASQPDRVQGAIMFLRLKGLEETAKAFTGTDNFSDVSKLSATNKAILAYLKANPDLGFIGVGGGKYDPLSKMTAKQYYKIMLTALGYTYSDTDATADFSYKTILSFAAGKGLTKLIDTEKFTVNDLAIGTVEALKANVKGATKTLVAQLAEANAAFADKAVTSGLYTKPVVALTVSSITTTNLKEVVVNYNMAVDKDTAEDKANYTLSAGGPALSATLEGNSVVLKLTSDRAQQESIDVTVKNVKNADKSLTIADTKKSVQLSDTTFPQALSATVTGPKTVEVAFSEPLKTVPTFKIDNGNYYAATTFAAGDKKITLTYGVELAAGNHTIVVKDGSDYATFKVPETTLTYSYAKDAVAPTVTVDKTTETVVTLKFSKKVKATNLNTDVTAYYAYNNDGSYKATLAAVDAVNGYSDKYTATFGTAIPAGTHNFYLNTKADKLEDTWGNDIASTVLPITITTDNVKPTVASVAMDGDKKMYVTYSEEVTTSDAQNKPYYTLKKADGTVVKNADFADVDDNGHFNANATLTYVNADKKVTIATTHNIPAGNYILSIEKVRDMAYVKNTMDAASFNITVDDKTAPEVSGAVISADGKKIRVTFSENMASDGLATLANYRLSVNGAASVAIDDKSTITVVNSKTVEISMPAAVANFEGSAGDKIVVSGTLKDTVGNAIGSFFDDALAISDAIAQANVKTDSEQQTAKNTIVFKFNQELSNIDASKILFNGTSDTTGTAVASAYFTPGTGEATVTVILAADQGTNKAGITNIWLAPDAVTNVFGTKNASSIVIAVGDMDDKVAPVIDSVETKTVTTIAITFSENINTATLSKYTFTVAGNTVTDAQYAAKVLTLTLKDAIAADATPAVTQALNLEDVPGNVKVAGSTVGDTTDKIVPTATVTTTTANALVLTFTEALYNGTTAIADGASVKGLFTYSGTAANYVSAVYNSTNKTVTFTFTAAEDTETLTPDAALKDAGGNAFAGVATFATSGNVWSLS